MTRVLSELLGAREPMFRRSIEKLEQASGHGSADVRLSVELSQGVRTKLRQLGLDPKDTTGEELYHALCERLKDDNARLSATLQEKYGASGEDATAHIAAALRTVPIPRSVYALKGSVAKRVLKKNSPKHLMKQLGYRSLDSLLKHENPATLIAVGQLVETSSWRKQLLDQYKKLKSSDFEIREIAIICPDTKRWEKLSANLVEQHKHTVLGIKELGSVVLLPLTKNQPPVATTVTLLLALHAINEVRAASTFLKLCQVNSGFGEVVRMIAMDEPALDADMLDRPVPWQIIQRYYARFNERFREEVFEPHVQQADLAWHSIERVLIHLDPSMEFWRHTTNLSLLHDHQPVSFNIIDVALSYCNGLPYNNRIVEYFRHSLWHELMIRYLKHDAVEQTVVSGLQARLVNEPALA